MNKFKGFEELSLSVLQKEILKSFDHHGELLQVEYAIQHLNQSPKEIREAIISLREKQLITGEAPFKLTRKAYKHGLNK